MVEGKMSEFLNIEFLNVKYYYYFFLFAIVCRPIMRSLRRPTDCQRDRLKRPSPLHLMRMIKFILRRFAGAEQALHFQ